MAIRLQMTPAAREARRQNARKSTGPRTAEGKRRTAENGRRAAASGPEHRSLPIPDLTGACEKLAFELAQAFEPANVAEQLLVEELSRLHFRKRVNQEAQTGLIQKNWEKLSRQRADHQLELTLEHSDHPAPMAVAAGYMTMEDSPAKFRQLSRMLSALRDNVKVGNFTCEGEELLRIIYGPCPSMRGAGILGNYRMLVENGYAPRAAAPDPAAAESPDGASAAVRAAGESEEAREERRDRAALESVREALLRALEEEKSLLSAKYVAFLNEHVPPPDALQRAAFVPADDAWRALVYQDQTLDRQIEAKTRLLLFLQWVRRMRERSSGPLYNKGGKARKD